MCLTSPSVSAATTDDSVESITVSPASTKLQLDTGATHTDELTVLNDGTVAYDFILYARPYSVKGEGYDPDFTGTPPNADAYRWVQFQEASVRIEPGQTIKVPYSLTIPKDAAPGGHYGVIFAETQPTAADGTSVSRKKRVGSLLYVTVNGTYTTGGQLLSSDIAWLQFRAPLAAAVTVENSGNADFDAKIQYKVSDLFGRTKYDTTKQYVILPKTIRKVTIDWPTAPWFGLFNVSATTSYLDKTSTTQSLVLVAPRWLLIAFVVVLVGGGVYAGLRRRK